MNNPFDEIRTAIIQSRELNRAVDANSNLLADLLDGRLRHVGSYKLSRLKRELRDFNIHTGKWKGD